MKLLVARRVRTSSVFISLFLFGVGAPAQALTVYTTNFAENGDSITGTISTNGNTGPIAITDILDWNLTVSVGGHSGTLTGPFSGGNSSPALSSGAPLSATTTGLFFDFNASDQFFSIAESGVPTVVGLFSVTSTMAPFVFVAVATDVDLISVGAENTQIASTATPLPAALPLFATGLSALGLLGWRRKRMISARRMARPL